METIDVRSERREEMVEITREVERVVASSGVEEGAVVLWSLHTTAGLAVNENADPDVATDIEAWMREAAPEGAGYRHREGNADSHIKATLAGPGVTLVVSGGEPVLGTWQGVFLCEYDGPRRRQVAAQVLEAS